MINDPRGKGLQSKQEGQNNKNNNNDGNIISTSSYNKAAASSSNTTTTSRQWSGFRNPRIVRVSRTFGGKDRHSKVSTVRGLRDRRIRLSVPTAIQLYDLQDRLGLNQPSKVIDWLLEVTDDDIEKLPPLQLLPHHGLLNTTSAFNPHQQLYQQQQLLNPLNMNFFDMNRRLSDNVALENSKGKSIEIGNYPHQDHDQDEALAHKLFPISNMPSSMAYNNYFHHQNQEPSCLSLSQFGSNQGFTLAPQMDHHMMSGNNNNGLSFSTSSTMVTMPMASQLFLCPSSTSTALPSIFRSYDHQAQARQQSNNSHMMQLLSASTPQNFAPSNVLMPSLHQYSVGSSLRSSFPTLDSLKLHSQHHSGSSSQPNKDD